MKGQNATLRAIGEFGLIERIKKWVPSGRGVMLGIGDDAAVLRSESGKVTLFTTDMLIEGRHFRMREASAYEVGWKALAVNISDIAAMGGLPTHAVVALGLPPDLRMGYLKELYQGLGALARRFHVSVAGGDTNASPRLVLSVSLLGKAAPAQIVTREGARPGDVIFVSGPLGGSSISRRHLTFVPKIRESQFLVKRFKPSAMIDLSDGLSGDIRRLAESSKVGVLLCAEAIPISASAKTLAHALGGGEDFELLFTLPPEKAARLSVDSAASRNFSFYPVGKIVPRRLGIRIVRRGVARTLSGKGYDHFA